MATKTSSKATSKKSVASSTSVEKIDYTFQDGTKFSGSFEQLQKVAEALGLKLVGVSKIPNGYYMSESRGLVKISDMNDYHIRRALLKKSKEYFTSVFDKDDTNRDFLEKYTGLTDDNIVVNLYNELSKRI